MSPIYYGTQQVEPQFLMAYCTVVHSYERYCTVSSSIEANGKNFNEILLYLLVSKELLVRFVSVSLYY